MKPPPFAYADPDSLAAALDLLSTHGDDGKVLAGGQSLVPLLNMRLAQPHVLIDLNRIDALAGIRGASRDAVEGIELGAMTRQSAVECSPLVRERAPLLAEGIGWVGHPQIRNRGTVGGSLAHADPAAELPLVFLALDGVATVASESGTRTIPAANFFEYTFTPALAPAELVTQVWVPGATPRTGYAFLEVARRHGDFALVAVAAALTLGTDGTVAGARVALGGAAPVPMRASGAERMLLGLRPDPETLRAAAALASSECEPSSDIHADAVYRREVAGTLAFRALTTAYKRIPGADA